MILAIVVLPVPVGPWNIHVDGGRLLICLRIAAMVDVFPKIPDRVRGLNDNANIWGLIAGCFSSVIGFFERVFLVEQSTLSDAEAPSL